MKIRFDRDFMGVETKEKLYLAGSVMECDDELGHNLITQHRGHAVVEELPEEPQAKPRRKRRTS